MTSWRDPPELEPLSASSWQRIERAVFAKLDAPVPVPAARGRWQLKPIHGVAALSAASLVALLFVVLAGGDAGPLHPTPSRVVTAEAPAHISVGRASLEIAPHSAAWVSSTADQGTSVMLEHGRVDCAVVHRPADPAFVVHAGDVRVEVVGTRFAVTRDEGAVQVEVTDGTVQVFHDGERTMVSAGQTWPRAESTDPAEVRKRDERARRKRAARRKARREAAARRAERRARDEADGDEDDQEAEDELPMSAKDRYETAARLESSDPTAAIAIYRELARESGPWAANALFARARLEHDRGNRRLARRLLERYMGRYRRGPNAADARALLEQIERTGD